MKCSMKEVNTNYHYRVMYDGSSLGDVFFCTNQPCKVRFYGWFPGGIPLRDLTEILEEIKKLEKMVANH